MKHLSLKDALLPQPPSFVKKQLYEVHEVLGAGTFGKVMVSCAISSGVPYCGIHVVGAGWAMGWAPGRCYRDLKLTFFSVLSS